MRMKDRIALNFPPLLLRLLLATIFIWAGLGKVMSSIEVDGQDAARLANMGVITPEGATDRGAFTAADFGEPVSVLRIYGLALRVDAAANPPTGSTASEEPMAYWPSGLGSGSWPVILAWSVAFAELVGGFCLLIGLLTRFWAVSVAGVMLGAVWLTQIGPAIQSGNTVLGFLPAYPRFSPPEWQLLMFQASLLIAALALAFLGAGRASVDHVLFGPARDDDYDDDDED